MCLHAYSFYKCEHHSKNFIQFWLLICVPIILVMVGILHLSVNVNPTPGSWVLELMNLWLVWGRTRGMGLRLDINRKLTSKVQNQSKIRKRDFGLWAVTIITKKNSFWSCLQRNNRLCFFCFIIEIAAASGGSFCSFWFDSLNSIKTKQQTELAFSNWIENHETSRALIEVGDKK